MCFCFFFSSRRRHTRFSRDWSSDVCSSDLATGWPATRMLLCGVQPEAARAFQHLKIGQLGALPRRCETLDDVIVYASTGRPPRSDRYLLCGGAGSADDAGLALGQACERWGLAD